MVDDGVYSRLYTLDIGDKEIDDLIFGNTREYFKIILIAFIIFFFIFIKFL